jgi:hypothetical protein
LNVGAATGANDGCSETWCPLQVTQHARKMSSASVGCVQPPRASNSVHDVPRLDPLLSWTRNPVKCGGWSMQMDGVGWPVGAEGEIVGEFDGDVVGDDVVGESDGDNVGAEVGEVVGVDVVGEPVGDAVGDEVVGEPVGVVVGDEVVGEPVGEMVGDEVGDWVGDNELTKKPPFPQSVTEEGSKALRPMRRGSAVILLAILLASSRPRLSGMNGMQMVVVVDDSVTMTGLLLSFGIMTLPRASNPGSPAP